MESQKNAKMTLVGPLKRQLPPANDYIVCYGNGIYGRHMTLRTTLMTFPVPFCFMEIKFAEACGGFGQFLVTKVESIFWFETTISVVQNCTLLPSAHCGKWK